HRLSSTGDFADFLKKRKEKTRNRVGPSKFLYHMVLHAHGLLKMINFKSILLHL
ncbi:hypothetical protein Ddye_026847, partial [Dipteronia dyeriana]